MIWRVVHSSHGFQFRSTTEGQDWPEAVLSRTDDFGLPLIGPLLPRAALMPPLEDEAVESVASMFPAATSPSALRDAA
jgi:hypothetical protein